MSRFALLAAALAALLQWAVPHGWMIGKARAGEAVLVPCPGVSPALAAFVGSAPASPLAAKPAMMPIMAMAHGGNQTAHHGDHAMTEAAAPAPAPAPDHTGHDSHASFASALCDFAAMGAPVLPPAPPVLDLLPPVPAAPRPLARLAILPGQGLAAPPPPATGPPSLMV